LFKSKIVTEFSFYIFFFSKDDEEEENHETSLGPLPIPPRAFPKANSASDKGKKKAGSGTSSTKRNELVVLFLQILLESKVCPIL